MRVALFPTCLTDAVTPEVAVATVRVLRRLGHQVDVPDRTTCCGQPAWNVGHAEPAAQVARVTLDALLEDRADLVVVPAGSCATMMRVFWSELFEVTGDRTHARRAQELAGRVRELSEVLVELGVPSPQRPDSTPTVYHHSCHMLRELRIQEQPEQVLDATGAERRISAATGRCCGFGGLFSVKLPEVSTAMADDVLDAATATGATRVVGCDTSCLLHLRGRAERRGLDLEFRHLATVVDRATQEGDPG